MNRFLSTLGVGALVFSLFCFGQPNSASAGLAFEDSININFSELGAASFTDVVNIRKLDFRGSLASNGVNAASPFTAPVAGVAARVVGFAENVGTTLTDLSNEGDVGDAGDFGHGGGDFELTIVVRDWNAQIESVDGDGLTEVTTVTFLYDDFDLTGFDLAGLPTGTGFVDLYVDRTTGFSNTDAAVSSDGTWIGTFGLVSLDSNVFPDPSRSEFTFDPTQGSLNGSGVTNVALQLIAAISDTIFQDAASGGNLLGGTLALLSLAESTESATFDPPLTNIFGAGGGDKIDIGAGWDPPENVGEFPSNWPTDIVTRATFDPLSSFAVIPEPSSIVMFSMAFLGLGLAGLRRRRQKNAVA